MFSVFICFIFVLVKEIAMWGQRVTIILRLVRLYLLQHYLEWVHLFQSYCFQKFHPLGSIIFWGVAFNFTTNLLYISW